MHYPFALQSHTVARRAISPDDKKLQSWSRRVESITRFRVIHYCTFRGCMDTVLIVGGCCWGIDIETIPPFRNL